MEYHQLRSIDCSGLLPALGQAIMIDTAQNKQALFVPYANESAQGNTITRIYHYGNRAQQSNRVQAHEVTAC